ncbi:MAG TPA: protein kinase, partial [Myxococcota bacterium]
MSAGVEPIGSYEIDGRLGAGGMGTVFRARHVHSGADVALKIAQKADPIATDSVRREIRLLGRIRHPGVVGLLDHGVHELRPWYAMELVPGERLLDVIGRWWSRAAATGLGDDDDTRPMRGMTGASSPSARPASPSPAYAGDDAPPRAPADRAQVCAGHLDDALQLFARLSQTLGYLHGEGIVHLDLKPQNILLRADGQPVVVDFGITRQVAGGLNREVLNVDPLAGGTDTYMAPEQIAGDATDARSDLYALGCILYEALTGRPPFLETVTQSVREQHLHNAPLPPSAWVNGVPQALDDVVLHLLKKPPEQRLGYAGDLLEVLCACGARIDPELAQKKPKAYLYRPRLIGRSALMDQLAGELARARSGVGRCVFLLGPSGSGKTRAVMELGRAAFAAEMRVVSGECAPVTLSAAPDAPALSDLGGGRPLHPFQSMLSTVVDLCNAGGPETTAALVGDALPVLENLEPMLARVAGRDRFPEALSAVSTYGRTEHALTATIVATAQVAPLLLVIDDLQWADSLSIAVIDALTKLPDTGHVCALITCRTDELSPALLELSRAPHAVRYQVEPLADRDVSQLVAGMLAVDDAPEELVQLIAPRAGGNPFYVAEYLQAAVSTGLLKRD